jgi:hypothetical protein
MTVRIIHRDNTAEEVTFTVSLDDFHEVIIQLLAVLGLPVIVPLVNRDNKTLVGALHIFYKLAF